MEVFVIFVNSATLKWSPLTMCYCYAQQFGRCGQDWWIGGACNGLLLGQLGAFSTGGLGSYLKSSKDQYGSLFHWLCCGLFGNV